MNRAIIAAAGLLGLSAAAPAFAQTDFSKVEVTTQEVIPGIYMLQGAGGNIGLSTGPDGSIVIDDQFAPLAPKIAAAVRKQSKHPVAFLLNTHWHGDHTGGNEAMAAAGAKIVAQDNVRKRLKEGLTRASGSITAPAPDAALPVITFSTAVNFYWNGHDIHVFHPAAAHTDGDAVVVFKDANVIHTGDVMFNGGFPFIDLESGGDLDGYIAAQEQILALADDQTKIIPGHGPLATKADLIAANDMLKDVRARIMALIDKGLDLDAVVKADPLKDLDAKWGQGFINSESMTKAAYNALTRK